MCDVRVRVEIEAQPGRGFTDAAPNLRGVLSDAGGEHDSVHAAKHRGERTNLHMKINPTSGPGASSHTIFAPIASIESVASEIDTTVMKKPMLF